MKSLVAILMFASLVITGCSVEDGPQEQKVSKQEAEQTIETNTRSGESHKPSPDADPYSALKQKPDGKIVLAFMMDSLTNESSQRHYQQIKNECAHRGWSTVEEPNVSGNYEADSTRKAFERVMAQNPDAIIIYFLDIPPIADLILQARKKGIGVYSVGTDLTAGMMLNVESAQAVQGAKMATYAIQRMGGSGNKVGFIDLWMPRGARRDIVAASLFEKGGWDFGGTMHHNLTPDGYTDELFNVVTDWLTKYGKQMSFVWTCWDLGAITAAQAMAAKGYTEHDMFTVGIDGGAQAWAYIRAGKIPFVASLADCFEYQTHLTCEAIDQLQVKGMKPGDANCIVPLDRYITTDSKTVIVDRSNVPAVGSNIHALFHYYGGDPQDAKAWYNWGTPYLVKDYVKH